MRIIYGDNVFYDDSSIMKFDTLIEKEFLMRFFKELSVLLGDSFSEYCFILYCSFDQQSMPSSVDWPSDKKVLFFISNETFQAPSMLSHHYQAIFKTFYANDNVHKNIFAFPLGYAGIDYDQPIIPMSDREYNFFFSGSINMNRVSLFHEFSRLRRWPIRNVYSVIKDLRILRRINRFDGDFSNYYESSYIHFTTRFGTGLNSLKYHEMLQNSKIALCPPGYILNYTYRHYEALKAGCVVLSLPLRENTFLYDSPIIQVNNWSEGLARAKELLQNKSEIEDISEKGINFYNEHLSAKSVARYVANNLRNVSKEMV